MIGAAQNGWRLLACGVAAVVLVGGAQAQIVERNLPLEPPRRAPTIRIGTQDLLNLTDETRLGVDLGGIVLLGAKDKVSQRRRVSGVEVERIPGIDAAAARAGLTPLIGRPLTRKLIGEAQAAIVAAYRNAGRPFVSVTIPPQEVTTGVLHVRVIEFRLGNVTVAGAAATPESYIRDRVRVSPGAPIDARRLETDLDWLNRNPFRQVEAVFGPGKDLALTDLTLQTTERRPWQVIAGYSNTGTLATDRDRFFLGATTANFPFTDMVASYQATGSKDFWVNNNRLFGDLERAQYMSHAGRVVVPLWPRSSLEVVANFVQTNQSAFDDHLRIQTQTTELSAIYRTAVSKLLPFEFGDLLAGAELKRQRRVTFFDEVDTDTHGNADVVQLVGGWNRRWSDQLGTNTFDTRIKFNPGGLLAHNTSADWNTFTNGRVTSIETPFATVEYTRSTPLFAGLSLLSELTALIANKALPDTERIAVGGAQVVRGYVIEDGTVDSAVILRNSIYLPPIRSPGPTGFDPVLAPFLFADIGWGRDIFLSRDTTLASVGAGLDAQVGIYARANLVVGYALRDGLDTQAGSWRVHLRGTVSY